MSSLPGNGRSDVGGAKVSALITQSNYIPWKGYFDAIDRADVFVLYDDAQYTKRDWRNRNRIKTHHGLLWLTIPTLVKGRFLQAVQDTEVADHDWAELHWRTLQHEYARAPWFTEYAPLLDVLYKRAAGLDRLSDVNCLFLGAMCDLLYIHTPMRWSREFTLVGDRNEKLIGMCKDLGVNRYLTGPAARAYLDEDLFRRAGIEVAWIEYAGYPEYEQLHGPFKHSVSIVDLILNEGPAAKDYIKTRTT